MTAKASISLFSALCLSAFVSGQEPAKSSAKDNPPAQQAPASERPAVGEKKPAREGEVGQGAVRTPKLVQRVGGNREISIEVVEGAYRCDDSTIESPLPDGYPEPTPPGAIDIKNYPSVRRAEFVSKDDSGMAMNAAFFPLFKHIKKREIAMTAPVEMDCVGLYSDFMKDEPASEGETTMSFLYRSPNLGPVGQDGKIVVRDTLAVTVLSVGVKGGLDPAQEMESLRAWLKAQQEWEVAGDPRMFIYNGPFIDPDARWSEVQVPIRRSGDAAKKEPAATPAKSSK
jgi:hypothetical protein